MITPGYRDQLRQMHVATGRPFGQKGFRYADDVCAYAARHHAKSILDYGSGKGSLRRALIELDVRNYDPGVPGDDALPEPADMVVSTDVLEHIEPEHLDAVLTHLFGLARKCVYLHVALVPAKQFLPDGRNAHLIVEGAPWWRARLAHVLDDWVIDRSDVGSKTMTLWITK